ncbi:hypothetical protein QQ045_026781 [Rhodiola kirilowii]
METNFSDLDEYFMMVIHDHLDLKRPRSESEDFVDILLRLSREAEGESRLSMNNIKSLIMVCYLPFHTHCACNTSFPMRFFGQDAFVGGVDTTAVSIVWAMAELLTHPNVLEKATAEVRSVAGEKHMVEESDIEQLKYIKCIVKEIFRLHPAAPLLIPHEAINSAKIGKDMMFWRKQGSLSMICPGVAMGSDTLTYVLANLLHCFDWEFPKGVRREDVCMEEEGGVSMHKKTPLIVVPTRIN